MVKYISLLLATMIASLVACVPPSLASNSAMVKSHVVDANGKPVQGAFIFFYDSPETKRAVDLVSPKTDKDGYCQKEVPVGQYWVLARLKEDANFDMGPLMIEDKVSGEAKEIEVVPGTPLTLEFTVLDLKDNILLRTKKRNDLSKISGRILDSKGSAVKNAYVFVNRHNQPVTFPDYFSPGSDAQGRFSLFLPNGEYFMGAETTLGADQKFRGEQALTVAGDSDGVEVHYKGVAPEQEQGPKKGAVAE